MTGTNTRRWRRFYRPTGAGAHATRRFRAPRRPAVVRLSAVELSDVFRIDGHEVVIAPEVDVIDFGDGFWQIGIQMYTDQLKLDLDNLPPAAEVSYTRHITGRPGASRPGDPR